MMTMKTLALAAAALLVATTAQAHSHKFKTLEIVHPWCIETSDTSEPVIVSMTIRNAGGRPDKLLSAKTPMAATAELREGGAVPDTEGHAIGSVAVASHG